VYCRAPPHYLTFYLCDNSALGLFVYIDFSSLLPARTFVYEEQLQDLLLQHARLVLTPGESQRDPRPGMFRICYAWVTPDVLAIAMERLSRLVAKLRRLDWDDLSDRSLKGILDY
jgi:aspartate/methionine/tyrosine aminotransferase